MNFESKLPQEPASRLSSEQNPETRIDLQLARKDLRRFDEVERERLGAAAIPQANRAEVNYPEKPPTPQEFIGYLNKALLKARRHRAQVADVHDEHDISAAA
jgi:hypothetical protein